MRSMVEGSLVEKDPPSIALRAVMIRSPRLPDAGSGCGAA